MTIKEMMWQEFKDSIYYPFGLGGQIWFGDIIAMCDGDRISVTLDLGKVDDGEYILERKKGTLYFYRAGHFGKILIYNKEGLVASLTEKQFKKNSVMGAVSHTLKFPRFFAKN